MKFTLISAAVLICLPCEAALIGSWNQNEASGNLIDSAGGAEFVSPVAGFTVLGR